ncbi:MAG TPA: hypothetical protein VJ020_04090 [Anaerolineales bacterium]|nr:hypothetical protein [Anaerolineales bacterium]
MNFIRKLFFPSSANSYRYYPLTVQCQRCGEIIHGRVDMFNELSIEYTGDANTFHCRKVLMGPGRCFQQIEVTLIFNANRKLTDKQIEGGKFVEG